MDKNGYIYVDAKTSEHIGQYLPRILMAKGIQETSKSKIIINAERVDENLVKVAELYGAHICVMRKNSVASIKAMILAAYFIMRKFDRTYILNYKYKNMPVGEYLYDTLIRINEKRCTIDYMKKIDFEALRWSLKEIICVYSMFCKKRPVVYLTHETDHLAGCTAMMAAYMGSHVFTCTLSGRIHYLGYGNKMTKFLHDVWRIGFEEQWNHGFPDDFVEEVDRYLGSRTSGKAGIDTQYAFLNKKIINRAEYVQQIGADASKKNIVIMCHVFSDTPHMSCYPKLYEDYYIWFIETLKIISKIENVNWIIKAHPSRELYKESEEVSELFTKYNNGINMWLWDDAYSTESLFDIADAVITVAGTCGMEFPCFGIPAITTGNAYYSRNGCNIVPRTIEEYMKLLEHLDEIERLGEKEVQTAHKVLYTQIHIYEPFDQVDRYLLQNSSEEGHYEHSAEKNRNVMEYITKNQEMLMSCQFIQEGRKWGKKIYS